VTWFTAAISFLLIAFFAALMRANEMFVIAVRDGRILVMRGRIPASLREDIRDVIARANVGRATLRVVRSGGAARMLTEGVDANVAQRLRNVLSLYPDHKLRAAPAPQGRNLGQLLGIAWLAFRLARETRQA